MQITRTADYAVRAVLHLAAHSGNGRVSSADIAREQQIPVVYISKVLQALSRAGIVESLPGRSGGMRLSRPASQISVLDVVEAMEGPIALNRCLIRTGECPRDRFCPVHGLWAEVQQDLVRRLKRATIARILAQPSVKGSRRK